MCVCVCISVCVWAIHLCEQLLEEREATTLATNHAAVLKSQLERALGVSYTAQKDAAEDYSAKIAALSKEIERVNGQHRDTLSELEGKKRTVDEFARKLASKEAEIGLLLNAKRVRAGVGHVHARLPVLGF